MKITEDVREYAKQADIEEAMQQKSKEFVEQGGQIYR
jgi:hypothetical protein